MNPARVHVCAHVNRSLGRCSRRGYIFDLEAIAQILPVLALKQHLPKQLLLFMDNEPSRRALVRYGKDGSVNKLMQVAWRFLEEAEFRPEWQCVMSSANISDKVSGFDFADAKRMGWTWLQHDWEAEFLRLLNAVKEGPLRRTFGARAQASLRSALASLALPAWSDECPYNCKSGLMRCVLLRFCAIACVVGSIFGVRACV